MTASFLCMHISLILVLFFYAVVSHPFIYCPSSHCCKCVSRWKEKREELQDFRHTDQRYKPNKSVINSAEGRMWKETLISISYCLAVVPSESYIFLSHRFAAAHTVRIKMAQMHGLDELDSYRPVTKINRIIWRNSMIRAKRKEGLSVRGWMGGREGRLLGGDGRVGCGGHSRGLILPMPCCSCAPESDWQIPLRRGGFCICQNSEGPANFLLQFSHFI